MEKPSHVKFVCRTFSDDEITELLDAGGNFREMATAWRDGLLKLMTDGKWDTGNGECLAIGEDGRVVNGQHRLSAAQIYQRETGDKVWFWVATGVRSSSDKSCDQGLNRTLASLLRKDGVHYATQCSAIAMADYRMSRVKNAKDLQPMFQGAWKNTVRVALPHSYEAWKRASAKISEWAAIANDLHAVGLPRTTLLACIGFQLAKRHELDAKLFFSYLKDGASLNAGDPILLLRERLMADRITAQAKMPGNTMAALLVKAWVAWKRGESMKTLRWKQVGPMAEKFPSHVIDETGEGGK